MRTSNREHIGRVTLFIYFAITTLQSGLPPGFVHHPFCAFYFYPLLTEPIALEHIFMAFLVSLKYFARRLLKRRRRKKYLFKFLFCSSCLGMEFKLGPYVEIRKKENNVG